MHFSMWDYVLAVAVCLQATVLAYLPSPKWKAFLVTLPIPFTLATLSVGRPVDVTNVLGTVVLLGFAHAIRLLYPRMPIIPAIALAAAGYCLVGATLVKVLPTGDLFFWPACGAVMLLGLLLYFQVQAPRDEPAHKTSLPVWVKAPIIFAVITLLVVLKQHLQGFMTMFPMVGVIAAYESRYSLWTFSRQIPVLMFTTVPMMIVIHLSQRFLGLGPALALGWLVFLGLLLPLTRDLRRTTGAAEVAQEV